LENLAFPILLLLLLFTQSTHARTLKYFQAHALIFSGANLGAVLTAARLKNEWSQKSTRNIWQTKREANYYLASRICNTLSQLSPKMQDALLGIQI